ncbi:hypothetical protein B0H15DRAFT_981423 [Mycena belliarum]|uniref:Uncharacterized protein n=1 Tax=Mycena belliarum TaxID=1033014 RepID=A0AAD6U931_9AGAR|nr:hypothetical protein B0H15DRAFT_981423 [Mycena belliae]
MTTKPAVLLPARIASAQYSTHQESQHISRTLARGTATWMQTAARLFALLPAGTPALSVVQRRRPVPPYLLFSQQSLRDAALGHPKSQHIPALPPPVVRPSVSPTGTIPPADLEVPLLYARSKPEAQIVLRVGRLACVVRGAVALCSASAVTRPGVSNTATTNASQALVAGNSFTCALCGVAALCSRSTRASWEALEAAVPTEYCRNTDVAEHSGPNVASRILENRSRSTKTLHSRAHFERVSGTFTPQQAWPKLQPPSHQIQIACPCLSSVHRRSCLPALDGDSKDFKVDNFEVDDSTSSPCAHPHFHHAIWQARLAPMATVLADVGRIALRRPGVGHAYQARQECLSPHLRRCGQQTTVPPPRLPPLPCSLHASSSHSHARGASSSSYECLALVPPSRRPSLSCLRVRSPHPRQRRAPRVKMPDAPSTGLRVVNARPPATLRSLSPLYASGGAGSTSSSGYMPGGTPAHLQPSTLRDRPPAPIKVVRDSCDIMAYGIAITTPANPPTAGTSPVSPESNNAGQQPTFPETPSALNPMSTSSGSPPITLQCAALSRVAPLNPD